MKLLPVTLLALFLLGCKEKEPDQPWVRYAIDAQRWRQCKWELPTEHGNYLVFLTRSKEGSKISHIEIMWYQGKGKWNTEPWIDNGYTVNVRYWLNLPQEPIVE